MLLSDTRIRELIDQGVLRDADPANVGPVTYDLRTDAFLVSGKRSESCSLEPGESVFVASKESIALPDDLAARVLIKNSRLRQGLALDAPLYFPGHETVVFLRITNISDSRIALDSRKPVAQIAFERVEGPVAAPYKGAFAKELDFRGLASYGEAYSAEIEKIEKKADEIKGIEKRIYSNVLTLMAIIAAVFTIVNVGANAPAFAGAFEAISIDLGIVGSFSFLACVISFVTESKEKRSWIPLLALSSIAFAAAFAVILFGAYCG